MNRPNDWDQVKEYGDYTPLETGGHYLTIIGVEETTSRNGKPMLKIAIDTAPNDSQPRYFSDVFESDTRPEKKWPANGVVYILTEDTFDGKTSTSRRLKTFITAIEKSNPGFVIPWGDGFARGLKGCLVGGNFGREEYIGNDGNPHWSVKCMQFRSTEEIEKGVEPPADKALSEAYEPDQSTTYYPIDDGSIPF